MKLGNYNQLRTDLEVLHRNLSILEDKLSRTRGTEFEPNVTDYKRIHDSVRSMKRRSAILTTML